ncbi:PfkB family carbohydrate kinase [Nocardiopsis sp. L17-MgMaSL7]|uniref:PfkB family carbohydrate kinase n=1 Tax=Nocardiopsis sp. L17-MgMaSL7 TaxID=1938893 RepID=UPI000D70BFF3|nr:PfkB family carbohydrate kinase [Nocardiopsis sp. L17-MgMaSL7]PWV44688.1 sugar/nucleoside kinase (ribokinase family) [Nocardiopsis sp. L17-MgMaSL7]
MSVRLHHVGPVIIDVVMTVEHLPEPGGDTFASSARTVPGGGFNVIAAATRAGMEVVYGGAHGKGPHGDLVRAALRDAGVVCAHPPRPRDTGFCVALVDSSAERTFVTHLGAETDLPLADLRALRPAEGDFVYTVGYSLLPGQRADELVTWIGELPQGVRLVLDPAPVVGDVPTGTLATVLARTDVLSLSAAEAVTVTGTADLHAAAAMLVKRVAPDGVVVLRDSAEGCLVATRDAEPVRVPGFAVEAVDTNGAGDAHVGVFTAALASGSSPWEAARRANAGAALAVTRPGPATSPTREELEGFLSARE